MTDTIIAGDELRAFIERAEQLAAEKRDIADQEKELFAEIKGRGYDTAAVKKLVAMRRKDQAARQEEDAILDLYMSALGME